MGTSAACELARRGHPVTVLEQHESGHARGSSHGSSRIMRMVYDDPFFVRLALSARPLWDDLLRLADVEVFHQCGSLDHGLRSHLEPFAAALEACDVPFEWLTPEAAEQRWPGLRIDEAAIFQPDGGVTHADNTLLTLRRLAEEAGATWHEHTRADSVVETTEGVTVTAGPRIFTADQVVVATGVWAHALTDLPEELATQVQPASTPTIATSLSSRPRSNSSAPTSTGGRPVSTPRRLRPRPASTERWPRTTSRWTGRGA